MNAQYESHATRWRHRFCRHLHTTDAIHLSVRAMQLVPLRNQDSSCVNYGGRWVECKEGLTSCNAARSHFPSVEAASYVLWAKSSRTSSGFSAVRTTSYGNINSRNAGSWNAAAGWTFASANPGGSG